MLKRFLAILLSVIMCFSLVSCGSSDDWVIYWYLCGSNLESEGGFATTDLLELVSVALPTGVKVVIETGGSQVWQNDDVDPTKLQRFVYDNEGLQLVDEQPSGSMGEKETLADFLRFAKENYPGERTAVLFWNHGGGTTSGAAFDELYDNDSLTLEEMHGAFSEVWQLSDSQPPLELIGFDTCLMATIDVAATFSDVAKYLVASEETEPGNGWLYSGWLDALAKNPKMDGKELGRNICDTFYAGCQASGTADNVTLSVTDLQKVAGLKEAYEALGAQVLKTGCQDGGFFSQFARIASCAENYGGNTKEQGFSNLVDLGHLARLIGDYLPEETAAVLSGLSDCISYKINGKYRSESSGLSCYYPYNSDIEDFEKFEKYGIGQAFRYFYSFGIRGDVGETGLSYLESLGVESLPVIDALSAYSWEDIKPELDDQGVVSICLGANAQNILSKIGFQLFYADPDTDTMYSLGYDNDLIADWETGTFFDNFRGVWGAIDGNLVYMELCFENEEYNLYSVPILLNGEDYNLLVAYEWETEEWVIIGAKKSIDESGMADKNLRLLTAGDVITTLHYCTCLSEPGDELVEVVTGELIVTDETSFGEAPLGDGMYVMVFEMEDVQGNIADSEGVVFLCENGEITTVVP